MGASLHETRLRQLSLPELRGYRNELREEEHRVSYWRRLLQARLDMVVAGRGHGVLTQRQIVTALGEGVRRHERLSLLVLHAGDELPELPELARLWAMPTSEAAGSIDELREAEATLSGYRSSLHRLLDAATAELVDRYRADPTRCFEVLPLPPELTATAATASA